MTQDEREHPEPEPAGDGELQDLADDGGPKGD